MQPAEAVTAMILELASAIMLLGAPWVKGQAGRLQGRRGKQCQRLRGRVSMHLLLVRRWRNTSKTTMGSSSCECLTHDTTGIEVSLFQHLWKGSIWLLTSALSSCRCRRRRAQIISAFLANGRAEDPDANVNAAPDPANLRIRDGLPAGPNRPQHFAPAGVQRAIGVGGARPFAAWQGRGGWAAALGAVGAARGHEDFFAGAGAGRRPAFDESKIPKNYESTMTHKRAARQGFSHDVIEPPTDVENYLTEPTRITGPLPDTTPICPGCRHALVLGVAGKRRLWGLPCGHVLDGRCVERLSHPFSSQPLELTQARARGHGQEHGHGHGKRRTRADAEFELDDEPPAKSTRGAKGKARAVSKGPEESPSSSSLATAAATSTTRPGPLPPPTPTLTVFRCPVAGCGQRVEARPGHRISAFELYI